jgi:cytochrome c oxidase assembly protein subunit 15
LATLGLLAAGGLVTSHGAGMAVPDWPNTYGYNLFFFPFSQWVGGVFYEHTHRLFGALVGLLTSVLALWLWGASARPWMRRLGLVLLAAALGALIAWPRRWSDALVLGLAGAALFASSFAWPRCGPSALWLRRLGLAAFVGVVLQGVLGGLRVVLFQDQIGIFHATLAQLFFVLVCALALFTSRWWQDAASVPSSLEARALPFLVMATTLLILGQLILGACMRHEHAGLAIPDFPLAYGKLWPPMDAASVALANQHRLETVALNPITSFQIGLQMAHRIVAALIVAAVALCAWQTWRRLGAKSALGKLALVWLGLVPAQALLGAMTIWSDKAADIATAHLLGGALLLVLGTFQCLLWFRPLMPAGRTPAPALDCGSPIFAGECRGESVEGGVSRQPGAALCASPLAPCPSPLAGSCARPNP